MQSLADVLARIRDGVARNAYPNETAVRTQIVQRVLHELGWDVFDPDRVCNEYTLKLKTTTRRIDLALCVSNRSPRCIVELKSTDHDLKQIGRSDGDRQLFEYAFHAGAPLALLTNGINWRFYSTLSAGTYAERLVRALDIETESLAEAATALERYLSFGNTESGRAADYARTDLDRRIDRHKAREAIPRAWTHLVENDPEQRLAVLLVEATSRLVDTAPSMEDVADFVRRLRPDIPRTRESRKVRAPAPKAPAPMATVVRSTEEAREGQVRYCLLGSQQVARNAREAYIAIFRQLADRDPDFLARVEPRLRGRKNRGVAEKKQDLSAVDAMKASASLLPGGWWLLTHMSNLQKLQALKKACESAGIPFGDQAGLDIHLPNT